MAGGQIVSDAELSDEVFGGFSSEEASDFENYSHQKKNTNVISKKVNLSSLKFLMLLTVIPCFRLSLKRLKSPKNLLVKMRV